MAEAATAIVIPPESKPGDSGRHVAILQRYLKSWGFDPGEVDATYSECTQAAVSALQRALGVAATGSYDAATQEAIRGDLRSGTSSVLLSPASTLLPPTVEMIAPQARQAPAVKDAGALPTATTGKSFGGLWSSHTLWLLAGGAALYFLTRDRPTITIDGVEEISSGDEEDDDDEEDEKKPAVGYHARAG